VSGREEFEFDRRWNEATIRTKRRVMRLVRQGRAAAAKEEASLALGKARQVRRFSKWFLAANTVVAAFWLSAGFLGLFILGGPGTPWQPFASAGGWLVLLGLGLFCQGRYRRAERLNREVAERP
jgi:hypothetical protein